MEITVAVCLSAVFASGLLWLWVHRWYRRLVLQSRLEVCHADGRLAPGDPPQTLFGNLPTVYGEANRLAAYNGMHARLGEIVQLFWMWRPQVSVSGYTMALRVLQSNQSNYRKHPPNAVLRLWSAEIPFSRPITPNQALGALAFNMLRAGGQGFLTSRNEICEAIRNHWIKAGHSICGRQGARRGPSCAGNRSPQDQANA